MSPFLVIVSIVAGLMFAAGAVAAIVRIVRGPSILDRVLATDVLLAISMCAAGASMALTGNIDLLPVLLVLALFAFTGTVAIARFMGKQDAS
ncbi:monovalent cation/H+ antiporter complex subunit F [Agromyces seonyuensis]|uniref:Sodium:proton antiporter n=1 Tax=Agromyces seonyuensis TaxID=2662446 RepID=A0A6I4NZF2_9MICO|nr:monovalent cation/H+ antiporter complex subunit F [Agromyces seonyuensis]MWB98612.1 sodium:proton antiporter [Agromyces seonyuensis]